MSSPRFMPIALATATLTVAASLPSYAQIAYPPYRGAFLDASVHFDVSPQEAEVYVDGYYAGIVDDFDGPFQRLRVAPGQHEIALYHEGYRTYRQRVYLARDRTFRVRARMEPLTPGDPAEPRPSPAPPQATTQAPRPLPGAAPRLPDGAASEVRQPAVGRLVIRIEPADAMVIIDGQPWPLGPGEDTLSLDVAGGRHVIQVRRPGYVGYLTEVIVRPEETTTLNVSLRAQP